MKSKRFTTGILIISILTIALSVGGKVINNRAVPLDDQRPAEVYIDETLTDKGNSTLYEGTKGEGDPDEAAETNYYIEPVTKEKPELEEGTDLITDDKKHSTVTLSVTCETILNNIDLFNKSKLGVLPEDGIVYYAREVEFSEGESAFDILLREMRNRKVHMEFVKTPIYNSNYIEGINNIYEFDCGELSGWMYKVNDRFPGYGASQYLPKDGDTIHWIYTCDLGRDIGGESSYMGGGER